MTQPQIISETITCDLCGSERHEQILVGLDLLHGTEGSWPVVRCLDCGLVFTNPRPAPESVGAVYPSTYSPYKAKKRKRKSRRWRLQQWALQHHWNYPAPRRTLPGKIVSWPFMLWTRGKKRNYDLFAYEGDGKLLDYGCASGAYLGRMEDRGWHVSGMDMSQQAIETCHQQGFDAHVGIAPDQQFPPDSFDVVSLWHVFEHVPSPTHTLEQVSAILKPNGKLVLGVPNINCLPARWFGKYWFALDLPRHVTHFSKETITKLLNRNGYEVEKIFAQRYGQTVQASFRYLGREKNSRISRFLCKYKRICYLIQYPTLLINQPAEIVVHARKRPDGDVK